MPTFLSISPIATTRDSGNHRITTQVNINGTTHPLWFESPDIPPDPAPEAPAGALLMAALVHNAHLDIPQPVCPRWLQNLEQIMQTWNRWWKYPILPAPPTLPNPRPAAPAIALCFTGGVDSFFSLLRGPHKPNILTFAHGYDIPLHDTQRLTPWEQEFRTIANATNARPILFRTNLRDNPAFDGQNWERSHGGALAALGHLLTPHAGTLIIASSFPTTYDMKWGSHFSLDHLWSSDRLTILHHGATHSRVGKVRELVHESLFQNHLRVCWENASPIGNCSHCDKCLCTMLLIAAHFPTSPFKTFHWQNNIPKLLDRVRYTRFVRTYAEFLTLNPDPILARSIRALLQRTNPKSLTDRLHRFTHHLLNPK